MKRNIDRRTMLKSIGAATIALPFLEEMMLSSAVGAVAGEPIPIRSFNVFFGLGIPAPLQTEGFDGVLEPLKPLSEKLRAMMTNLSVLQRITLSLCAIATLATILALAGPRHRLSQDLEQASRDRLARAGAATAQLISGAQEHLRERHRSISRTPEFRANLETADVPTLSALAKSLVKREQSIDAVVFTNSKGTRVAVAGVPRRPLCRPWIHHRPPACRQSRRLCCPWRIPGHWLPRASGNER